MWGTPWYSNSADTCVDFQNSKLVKNQNYVDLLWTNTLDSHPTLE
jgi:hypothetical protein